MLSIHKHENPLKNGSHDVSMSNSRHKKVRSINDITELVNKSKPIDFDFTNLPIQPKLKINAQGDHYEQEADRIANRVVNIKTAGGTEETGKPKIQKESLSDEIKNIGGLRTQRKCSKCEKEEEVLQRKLMNTKSPMATESLSSQLSQTRGKGDSMDKSTNQYMSSRFGVDFSHVTIHRDEKAANMSQSIKAKAFTLGNDIYFNKGEYNPQSIEGKRLLAHELVHTVQQKGNLKIQRSCEEESFYSGSVNYCRDDTFSPLTHSGATCYRQIPNRTSYFSCPPGEHVCFDEDGNCEDSPDSSSLAESKESDGSCNFNQFCIGSHTLNDFVPAVTQDIIGPEASNEFSKLFDWREMYRAFGGWY